MEKGTRMPKRSLESKIKEHQKYRSQCQVRIRSGIRLLLICLVLEILLLLYTAQMWRLVLVVLVIISGSTLLEVWGYRKHHKALAELTRQSKAAKA